METRASHKPYDIFIVGGGINGCGIARDAAGRGLSVCLAEMNDLGGATSSASTKLFHGGLRYLEYFEFGLVRHALREREILLGAMPHISRPMRFVLPYHTSMRFENSTPVSRMLNLFAPWMKGRRPAWLIRFGLFLYDHLGGRKILPPTAVLSLKSGPEGKPLLDVYEKAYEYSDCWVDDARLVILNARDAEEKGAEFMLRTKVVNASRSKESWDITVRDQITGTKRTVVAKMIINAAGPWVGDVIQNCAQLHSQENVRLVRGSHIVTPKLYDHEKCYFFQGSDGRIVFAIPYETDFTLLGTTDCDHGSIDENPVCTDEEAEYLVEFANQYFQQPISTKDIVWRYSGVRPLYDDGTKSASAATRDYVLRVDSEAGAPILNIFGGKITTYRCLAEDVLQKVKEFFPGIQGGWTAGVALPGGDFPVDGLQILGSQLRERYNFLTEDWAKRLIKAYGTEAKLVLGNAAQLSDLGYNFGATLTEAEVRWLVAREFAQTAEDIIWRRSKLGLRLRSEEVHTLDRWMKNRRRQAKLEAAGAFCV